MAPQKVFGPARMVQQERESKLDEYAARLATIFDEVQIQVFEY
ncbi:hypothetical protein [Vibrio sp. Isolate24]|nr:hypothetical protein [Vibrio sp. Isolate24]